ncbi:MAG TPA: 16S rRNA (uracil(1498)-N(3))-methyltransferase [Ktedonobacteraceae bacterium]
MHRFFVSPELVQQPGASITLPKELAHQFRDVLHLQAGEQVMLLDNSGDEMLASVVSVNKSAVDVQLLERRPGKSESPVRIILCQGLLKSARFEWILEKGTELGVSVFSPILCRRSMTGLEDAGTSKMQRWQRIITEAAEQSGRARLPELLPIRTLKDALANIPPDALALMPWEEEHGLTLRDALRNTVHSKGGDRVDEGRGPLRSPSSPKPLLQSGTTITIVLFIGPEGGLTIEEIKQAQQHGAQIVSLGSRILRAETAALVAVANVMYELGG